MDHSSFRIDSPLLGITDDMIPDPPMTSFIKDFRRELKAATFDAKQKGMQARLSLLHPLGVFPVFRISDFDGVFAGVDVIPATESDSPRRIYLHHSALQLMIEYVSEKEIAAEPEERRAIGFNVDLIGREEPSDE